MREATASGSTPFSSQIAAVVARVSPVCRTNTSRGITMDPPGRS